MVNTAGVSYQFTLYSSNPFAKGSAIYIKWPSDWTLDCTDSASKYSIANGNAAANCQPTAFFCDTALQTFKIFNCFQDNTISAPGPVIFNVIGITNPADTATKELIVST